MVVGYSNAGKSISTQALAFDIAMGRPAWGQFITTAAPRPVPRRGEHHRDPRELRAVRVRGGRADDGGSAVADARRQPVLHGRPERGGRDRRGHSSGNYGAVFIDTFRASAPGRRRERKEASGPLYMLGRVSTGTDAAITVLHHEKKPDDNKRGAAEHMISGHNSIHGTLQVAISMVRDDESGTIEVRPSKRIRKGFDPFQLRIVDVGGDNVGESIAAGESSPGVRVEYVGAAAAKPVNEDTMSAAIVRILAWLRTNAPDGRQIRLESLLKKTEEGGAGGRKSMNQSAIERLERDGQVHVHGSPKMIALVVDAPPYDPRSVAPPSDPSSHENQDDLASALIAQREANR
jgi:hypothetical protein